MKLDKDQYLHFNACSKNCPPFPWDLIFAHYTHDEGFPLQDNRFGHNEADYWAIEAELIARTIITDTWSDLEPDGKAFAAAWDRSDR